MNIKPTQILSVAPYYIVCQFNNGEIKKIDVTSCLDKNNIYVKTILTENVFKTAKIGELGQIFWDNIAEMKDENNNTIKCEYDLSPEFVYHYSTSL